MSLRFPAVKIANQAEFTAWFEQARPLLDQRWLYEQRQIKSGQSEIRDGTCGLCLAPAQFHSTHLAAARNWREEMLCDCGHRLNNRQRAFLHYLRASHALSPVQSLAVVGPETAMESKLEEWGIGRTNLLRLIAGKLQPPDQTFGMVICSDYLQHVPLAPLMLQEFGRIARSGAVLAITVPFDVSAAQTRSRVHELPPGAMESAEPLHLFGWDLLDIMRDVGFGDVAAHFYWSDEFGYLGPFNMIISGIRL